MMKIFCRVLMKGKNMTKLDLRFRFKQAGLKEKKPRFKKI